MSSAADLPLVTPCASFEEWKRLRGTYDGGENFAYAAVQQGVLSITPSGEIWRIAEWHFNGRGEPALRPCEPRRAEHLNEKGYLRITVQIDGVQITARAHRLVYRHFFGPIPEGLTVNHKNGIKIDNQPDNFELATMVEQSAHARHVLGRRMSAKINTDDVAAIILRRKNGELLKSVAADYPIGIPAISMIVNGKRRVA